MISGRHMRNCVSSDAHLAYINSLEKQLAMEEYLSSISSVCEYQTGCN